ncbi:MAG TPA: ABC transporter ATP-binding protein [Bacillota bacterium]|nr:ABC transporter ATP-binding protein [Bacillota bacterium]
MIELVNVTKQFGNLVAVQGISLSVGTGEIFGLVGPDGAGKTTTIRMLTGVADPSGGTVRVLGETNIEKIKSHLGYVPQRFSLYPDLTVMENIRFIGALYGADQQRIAAKAAEILQFTKLWAFRDRLAGNLSGGMKQKLALAAGLMHQPTLFFLDEPTTGVDPVSRREFWQMLYSLNKNGMTIFVSTPYMDEAELCTKVAFMHEGRIVTTDTPDQLKRQYPHRLLELQVRHKDVKSLLAGCPVREVNSFGEKYHLVVDEPVVAVTAVRQALTAAGLEVLGLTEIAPTMEDVFVAMAGEVS